MDISSCLSPSESQDTECDAVMAITNVDDKCSISVEDVKRASVEDPIMRKLIETISCGFPETQHMTDPDLRKYFNVKNHLWIQDGVVMFKNRVVVPTALQERSLKKSNHQLRL